MQAPLSVLRMFDSTLENCVSELKQDEIIKGAVRWSSVGSPSTLRDHQGAGLRENEQPEEDTKDDFASKCLDA